MYFSISFTFLYNFMKKFPKLEKGNPFSDQTHFERIRFYLSVSEMTLLYGGREGLQKTAIKYGTVINFIDDFVWDMRSTFCI